jgi:phage terminase Nu1 subunit (DNA packaging protein)
MPVSKTDLHQVSINQLEMLTGKSYRTIKAALSGLGSASGDGRALRYPAPEALARIYQAKPESQRARLDRARADAQEMQNKVARGEYAPIELISDCLSDVASQIRSILTALPKRLKASMPELRARELDIIRRQISEAMKAMAACRPRNLG